MAITAADVKKLREQTGVGMMDCKKALTQANGDFEAAIALLREKGIAVAAKREDRTAAEGVLVIKNTGKAISMVELNCETSFVAANDDFMALAAEIAGKACGFDGDIDALKAQTLASGRTIAEAITDSMARIGEKIDCPRFACLTAGPADALDGYVHSDKLKGVIVKLTCDSEAAAADPDTARLAKDIAMHAAWTAPKYLDAKDVPEEEVEKEREIQINRAKEEGKPEEIARKMVEGRLRKEFFANICLTQQPYIKEEKITVGQLVADYAKSKGCKVSIAAFVRFRVGEQS
ncbi:MAG: elongation factor Ts [Abditibacteriota bacterium]|nr:elongation factor Ts [Abditibacteriota bacterium]